MNNRISKKVDEISKSLLELEQIVFNDLVSWESVKNIKIGEVFNVDGSINKKIYQEFNIMIFETIIPPYTEFPAHWHDFKEKNFIIKGDYFNSEGKQQESSWVEYEKHEKHKVLNKGKTDLKLIVIFTKD